VAELVGADTDSEPAIRWLILMMALCCDPSAIALTAAASARHWGILAFTSSQKYGEVRGGISGREEHHMAKTHMAHPLDQGILAAPLFALLMPFSTANASPCDDFNMLRFDPSRLEQCIKDMKFTTDVRINTLQTENHVLQSQICILALELKEVRPSAFDAIKESCVPGKPRRPPSTAPGPGTKR
jgi:hypothetical protein